MIGQPEHVEKLDRILFHFREYDLGARDRGGIDHTEQYRHPDAVYNVRLREINDKLFAAFVQAEPALSLDLLARYFVEIIARKHNSAFIINRRGNIRFSLTDHIYFFLVIVYCAKRKKLLEEWFYHNKLDKTTKFVNEFVSSKFPKRNVPTFVSIGIRTAFQQIEVKKGPNSREKRLDSREKRPVSREKLMNSIEKAFKNVGRLILMAN